MLTVDNDLARATEALSCTWGPGYTFGITEDGDAVRGEDPRGLVVTGPPDDVYRQLAAALPEPPQAPPPISGDGG